MAKQIRVTLAAAKELLFKHYGLTTLKIKEVSGSHCQNYIVSAVLKDAQCHYIFKIVKNTESERKSKCCCMVLY